MRRAPMRPIPKWRLPLAVALLAFLLAACSSEREAQDRLRQAANRINQALVATRDEVLALREAIREVLSDRAALESAAAPDPKKHAFYQDRAYHKFKDDDLCGLWASGFAPADAAVLRRISRLETLQPLFRQTVLEHDLIVQAYFLSADHFALFYPYLDSLAYFTPLTDFGQAFAPYYEAAPDKNPSQSVKWLEPYVDATGKGVMVTATCPVMVEGRFAGAAGVDVLAARIKESLLDQPVCRMALTTGNVVLAVSDACAGLLDVPDYSKYRYLEGVEKDFYVKDAASLDHDEEPLRELLRQLGTADAIRARTNGANLEVRQAPIPETGWRLVEVVEP